MKRWTNEEGVQGLFEVFTASHRLILNSLDCRQVRFTKYQLYLMMALSRERCMTMGQAAASIGCSKEQATRLVTSLEEEGYVERLHSEENRKLVMVQLTEKGAEVMGFEKSAARENLKERLNRLSDEDKDTFFQAIRQLAQVLRKLEEESAAHK
ncbi:MAG: MarR family transcriptional regulator [Lachnospiraceae bacterium]|nr:MarR family transcriptional regulator [Lachnospiraceae bacterium]